MFTTNALEVLQCHFFQKQEVKQLRDFMGQKLRYLTNFENFYKVLKPI